MDGLEVVVMLKRIWCALTGHPDTASHWGTVRRLAGNRIAREVTEICVRCECVVNRATLRLEGGRWQ